jgi:hypothetical protein
MKILGKRGFVQCGRVALWEKFAGIQPHFKPSCS